MAATAEIANGRNNDVTPGDAGAVIMNNSLTKVAEYMDISHRLQIITLQSRGRRNGPEHFRDDLRRHRPSQPSQWIDQPGNQRRADPTARLARRIFAQK